MAVTISGMDSLEPYKVSLKYDNPAARRAHDFPVDLQQKEIKEELDPAKL